MVILFIQVLKMLQELKKIQSKNKWSRRRIYKIYIFKWFKSKKMDLFIYDNIDIPIDSKLEIAQSSMLGGKILL